jgi:outer membrane biosynthesis protein TonB
MSQGYADCLTVRDDEMTVRHSPKALVIVASLMIVAALACNLPGVTGPAATQPPPQATQPQTLPSEAPPTQTTQAPPPVEQPTLAPPPTETPSPTVTPSPSPSATTNVITMGAPEVSTTTLYKGAGACEPKEITFSITVTNPDQVKNVILFLRTQDKSTASKTDWDEGTALNPRSGGKYTRTYHSADIPTYGSFGNAWLYYQFVVTDKQNKLIRGRVFTDVSFIACP